MGSGSTADDPPVTGSSTGTPGQDDTNDDGPPSTTMAEPDLGDDPPPPPPAECGTNPLGLAAEQLGPGEWVELATEGLTHELLDGENGHHITQYTFKAVFDPTWCRVLFIGGGHLSRVKFISYDLSLNQWTQETNPSWWCDPYAVEDFWPCVGHAYGHNAIDVENGRYYYKYGGRVRVAELQGVLGSEWDDVPDHGVNSTYTSLAYFPEMEALVLVDYIGERLLVLEDGADGWVPIDGPFPMGAYHIYAIYNPIESLVIFGSGNGSADFSALHPDGSVTSLSPSPRTFHPEPNDDSVFKILIPDPVSGDLLAYGQGGDLFTYDFASDAWSDTNVVLPADVELAVPVPDYGVVLLIDGRNELTYVYKHAG